jgi:type II secretory pathway pseudopilin PulG
MRDNLTKGLTLVEVMIIAMVIILVASIAIPNLLRQRLLANEASAVSSMSTILSAAQNYRVSNPTYPANLDSLWSGLDVPYIDSVLGQGIKNGYRFSLIGDSSNFVAVAVPQAWGKTGNRSFL